MTSTVFPLHCSSDHCWKGQHASHVARSASGLSPHLAQSVCKMSQGYPVPPSEEMCFTQRLRGHSSLLYFLSHRTCFVSLLCWHLFFKSTQGRIIQLSSFPISSHFLLGSPTSCGLQIVLKCLSLPLISPPNLKGHLSKCLLSTSLRKAQIASQTQHGNE